MTDATPDRSVAAPAAALPLAVGFALLTLAPGLAMSMDAKLGLSASSIYSDNITLAQSGEEESDLVFLLNPKFSLTDTGSRYQFQLDYELQMLYFTNQSDSTEYFNVGDADLNFELIKEHLFLGTSASVAQVIKDPAQPLSYSNIPLISNRTNAVTIAASPEWRQQVLDNSLDIKYTFGRINYGAQDLQDVNFQELESNLVSPDKDHGLTWSAHHEYYKYVYSLPPQAVHQLVDLSLYWNLSGGWAPFASGGFESDVNDRTDPSLTNGIWAVGVRRNTPRLKMEASFGERSFGHTWAASLERQFGSMKGSFIRLSYSETPETAESISLSNTRPAYDPGNPGIPPITIPPGTVPPGVVAPGTGGFFIDKNAQASAGLGFARSTISAGWFYDKTTGNQDVLDNQFSETEQQGGRIGWQYTLGARTQLVTWALLTFRRFTQPDGYECGDQICTVDTYRIFRARIGIDYALGAKTTLGSYIQQAEQQGSNIPTNNYTENQIGVTIQRNFF